MVKKIPSGHKEGKSKGVCIRKGIKKKIAHTICKIIKCGNLEDANAEEANILFWKKDDTIHKCKAIHFLHEQNKIMQ